MKSSAQKGAYYKARTRKYYAARGWQVADLEIVRWVQTPRGRVPVKRDQLGSDLLLVSGNGVVFVQAKGGLKCDRRKAAREFARFAFPAIASLWIVYWRPGAREPEVTDVREVYSDVLAGTVIGGRQDG